MIFIKKHHLYKYTHWKKVVFDAAIKEMHPGRASAAP